MGGFPFTDPIASAQPKQQANSPPQQQFLALPVSWHDTFESSRHQSSGKSLQDNL